MAIFGPIWTQFRSKQLKIWPESHWIDRIDRIDIGSIGSISDRSDRYRIDRIDPMAFWPNFKLFRPKLSPNRTKNGHFKLFRPKLSPNRTKNSHFCDWRQNLAFLIFLTWLLSSQIVVSKKFWLFLATKYVTWTFFVLENSNFKTSYFRLFLLKIAYYRQLVTLTKLISL